MADVATLGVEVKTTGAAQAGGELEKFSASAKKAAGASDQLEDMLRQQSAAQERLTSTARPVSGAMQSVGQAFSRNSSAIQNASFQLQDMVVQMSMGAPAARTLGMQLPQLLGGFGPLGAVVGLAVGALLTFAPALFDTGEAAENLKDKMDALEGAMQRLNAAQKGQSLQDLSAQYGAQAAAAKELLEIQKQLAQIEAERAFRAASGAVVGAMGEGLQAQTFQSALDNAMALNFALREQAEVAKVTQQIQEGSLTLNEEEAAALGRRRRAYEDILGMIAPYRRGLEAITEQFGLTEQSAANLVIQMTAVKEADTTEARVSATQNLARAIDEATGGLNMASDEGIALYNALLDAALAGLDLQNLDIESGISAAASSAAELAAKLGVSVELAARLKAGGYEAPRDVIFDPRDPKFNRLAAEAERLRLSAGTTSPFAPSASKASGGSGGGASADAQEAARLFASTRTEAERYAAELDKVETLYRSGAISGEVYTRAIEDLNEKFDPFTKLVADVADTVENELNSAFASVLKGTADLGDALLSFASNVLAKVAQDLFAQQFAAPIAEGIKTIFSADGNVFNQSGVTAFAKGGVVKGPTIFPFASGIGLMGEAGPEAIMPLKRGPDGALGVSASTDARAPVIVNDYSTHEVVGSALIDAIKELLRAQATQAKVVPFAPKLDVQRQIVPFTPELDVQRQVVPFAPKLDVQRQIVPFTPEPIKAPTEPLPAAQKPAATQGAAQPNITINNYSGQEATASTDSAGNVTIDIGRLVAQDITAGGPAYRAIKSTFGLSNRLQQRG